ncbi:MAG: WD40/YVTN/BNR-like repeat-containing protein, partial [Chloroflexota bacterium]
QPGRLWLQMESGAPAYLHLYRSDNAGGSWQEIPTGGTPMSASPASSLPVASDPRFPGGLWIGSNRGLYHTTDAGQTWEHIGGGLPPTMPIDGLAVSPFDEQRLLAWRNESGLYASDDGGRAWQHSPIPFFGQYTCRATFDPLDRLHIYLACNADVYASDDGGRTWSNGAGRIGVTGILASAGHPGLAYLVGRNRKVSDFLPHGEVFRTTDGGATWQPWAGGDMLASDTIVAIAGVVP